MRVVFINKELQIMTTNRLERDEVATASYHHQQWELRRRFLRFLIKNIGFTLLLKVDHVEGQENVPKTGGAILMINHIAFVDSLATLQLCPRHIVPLAKIEVYDYPVIGIFPRLWGVIPVRREEVDRQAIRQALEVLQAGEIILMAPEGTRGKQLQQGKEGIAYIASRSGAPIVPVAISNTPGFPALRFTSRWKGPGARIIFGRPFRFRGDFNRPDRAMLRKMTDEAMYVLSAMLPEGLRGHYADLSQATQDTIERL
jgi:1-acyl-sn-glycerol-3-phosphate acyltransferase